jgi:hypothetical protein
MAWNPERREGADAANIARDEAKQSFTNIIDVLYNRVVTQVQDQIQAINKGINRAIVQIYAQALAPTLIGDLAQALGMGARNLVEVLAQSRTQA